MRRALLAVLCWPLITSAQPYRPEHADVVLLRLKAPSARILSAQPTMRELLDEAERAMSLGRATLDDRHFGRAETLLRRALPCVSGGLDAVDAARCDPRASDALIAYADLLQHGHDFAAAERVLGLVIERDASHARARLLRATVRLARGEPRAALSDCTRLVGVADSLLATSCVAQSIGLMGRLAEAVALLESTLEKYSARDERSAWAWATLAEQFERQGRFTDALSAMDRARSADPDNVALRLQASDLFLRHDRAHDAARLLAGLPMAEPVVLRRALAATLTNEPQAAALQEEWRALVAAQDALGSSAHERDRALGALRLLNRPREALQRALANWARSRDLEDARTLILTANAAGSPQAAAPALEWLSTLRVEDALIDAMRAQASP